MVRVCCFVSGTATVVATTLDAEAGREQLTDLDAPESRLTRPEAAPGCTSGQYPDRYDIAREVISHEFRLCLRQRTETVVIQSIELTPEKVSETVSAGASANATAASETARAPDATHRLLRRRR